MGKFLTKFDELRYFCEVPPNSSAAAYPLLLSAAIGDVEDDLYLKYSYYSPANTLLGTGSSSITGTWTNSVIHFNVRDIVGVYDRETVKYFTTYIETGSGEVVSDTIRVNIQNTCTQPIYLLGRNSLGGALGWMFEVNQEYSFDYANKIKAKRLSLQTDHLTLNEWEGLQDFITLGDEYRVNIQEFTSATIKTSARIGQQLYVIDTAGNKIGVTSISVKNKTFTKQQKHFFEMEIEYPEVFTV